MTTDQYLAAIHAARDLPDASYLRAVVDISCLANRRWLRSTCPGYPISYRDYQAVELPYEAFSGDPELLAQLQLPDSVLVIEAGGQLTVIEVPTLGVA